MTSIWQSIYNYGAHHRWVRSMLLANVAYFVLMFVYHIIRGLFHAYPVHAGLFWIAWLILNVVVFLMNYLVFSQTQKKNQEG
ncbi:hypothetical protein [Limosilactobacillus sp.]|uniref:hypothetical protein n=1 Tax=Limosilactobacillus sp. TaxID=2773925 RepID=UPI00345EEB82